MFHSLSRVTTSQLRILIDVLVQASASLMQSSILLKDFNCLVCVSDCVRAEPVIFKKLESASDDIALLRAYVGDRPTWRNPLHPWRVDSRFKLTGVPTLVRWEENDKISGRLEDHEAHVEKKIDALVAGK